MAAKDTFYFAALGELAGLAASGAHSLADAVRTRRVDELRSLYDAHERARVCVGEIRASLVETWLPPLDRDDLRELATVLARLTKSAAAVGACLDQRSFIPTVGEAADLFSRGCERVKLSTELLADLRGNRDALARAAKEELAIVHAAREVFVAALRRAADGEAPSPTNLLQIIATRDVLERQRRAIETLHVHAILLETLLLEYA